MQTDTKLVHLIPSDHAGIRPRRRVALTHLTFQYVFKGWNTKGTRFWSLLFTGVCGLFSVWSKETLRFCQWTELGPEHQLLTSVTEDVRGMLCHVSTYLTTHRIPHGRGKKKIWCSTPSNCWMKRWCCSVGVSLSTRSMPSCKNDLKGNVSPGVLWAWNSGANGLTPKNQLPEQ